MWNAVHGINCEWEKNINFDYSPYTHYASAIYRFLPIPFGGMPRKLNRSGPRVTKKEFCKENSSLTLLKLYLSLHSVFKLTNKLAITSLSTVWSLTPWYCKQILLFGWKKFRAQHAINLETPSYLILATRNSIA